jgi:hypothetical protein
VVPYRFGLLLKPLSVTFGWHRCKKGSLTIAGLDPLSECEAIVDEHSRANDNDGANNSIEGQDPRWVNAIALLFWILAGAVAFLPFAFDTSPWDALMLRVPGNQGNWWHFLAAAPFFLAFPMIWLRLRGLFSSQRSTATGRRLIWSAVGLSIAGTIAVEAPFLLHLAGTSAWQRLSVLSLGLGIVIASAAILLIRRRHISPTRACLVGLITAYLANAALCLVVYNEAPGGIESRSGWLVSILIVWPILLELIWLFIQTFRPQRSQIEPRTA